MTPRPIPQLIRTLCAASLITAGIIAPLQAANMAFLKNKPIAELKADELEDFKRALAAALDQEPDGSEVAWQSQTSDASASIRMLSTYESDQRQCRKLASHMEAGGRQGQNYLHVCRDAEGHWKLQRSPFADIPDADIRQLEQEVSFALDNTADGVPYPWSSGQDGNTGRVSGSIVPLDTRTTPDGVCRKLALTAHLPAGHQASGQFDFCRDTEGAWHHQPQ